MRIKEQGKLIDPHLWKKGELSAIKSAFVKQVSLGRYIVTSKETGKIQEFLDSVVNHITGAHKLQVKTNLLSSFFQSIQHHRHTPLTLSGRVHSTLDCYSTDIRQTSGTLQVHLLLSVGSSDRTCDCYWLFFVYSH